MVIYCAIIATSWGLSSLSKWWLYKQQEP
jgi:hypothetical protein